MPERFRNQCNIHSRPLQNRGVCMASNIGCQGEFQPQTLTPPFQFSVYVSQNFIQSIAFLQWCYVNIFVKYREDIILLGFALSTIFIHNLLSLRQDTATHHLTRLLATIKDSTSSIISTSQHCNISKIHPCREV